MIYPPIHDKLINLSQSSEIWACIQIVNYLLGLLNSTPEALGDSQRETPEELQERYERTVSSSLRSLTSLLGKILEHQILIQVIEESWLILVHILGFFSSWLDYSWLRIERKIGLALTKANRYEEFRI